MMTTWMKSHLNCLTCHLSRLRGPVVRLVQVSGVSCVSHDAVHKKQGSQSPRCWTPSSIHHAIEAASCRGSRGSQSAWAGQTRNGELRIFKNSRQGVQNKYITSTTQTIPDPNFHSSLPRHGKHGKSNCACTSPANPQHRCAFSKNASARTLPRTECTSSSSVAGERVRTLAEPTQSSNPQLVTPSADQARQVDPTTKEHRRGKTEYPHSSQKDLSHDKLVQCCRRPYSAPHVRKFIATHVPVPVREYCPRSPSTALEAQLHGRANSA